MKRYQPVLTKRFRRDVKRLKKSGADVQKMEHAIELLASGINLPSQYKDHELRASMQGIRECHIGPDWLLLYQKDNDRLLLILVRTGDHRQVLGIE